MKFILSMICLFILHTQTFGQIIGIKISGDTCTNLTLSLQVLGTSNSSYFFWQFGDPASGTNDSITITGASSPPFPIHAFSSPGIYQVCVSFQEPGSPVTTICRTLSVGLCCQGIISSADTCLQNSISFLLSTGASVNAIDWNFGDIASGANNFSNAINPSHTFSSVGTYVVTATVTASCGIFTDTATISVVNCSAEPCTGVIVYSDTCLDGPTALQINASYPLLSVNWNFDDPASGVFNTATVSNPSHQFTNSGIYHLTAYVTFNCGVDTLGKNVEIIRCDTINNTACKLSIPNAFSPNQDNVNDYFLPLSACPFEKYELLIYNRWGEQIFKSTNPTFRWNGDYKGLACPVGVYGYLLNYKFPNYPSGVRKGDLTIIK